MREIFASEKGAFILAGFNFVRNGGENSKGLSFVWRLVLFAVRMAAFCARVAIQIERYASLNLTSLLALGSCIHDGYSPLSSYMEKEMKVLRSKATQISCTL